MGRIEAQVYLGQFEALAYLDRFEAQVYLGRFGALAYLGRFEAQVYLGRSEVPVCSLDQFEGLARCLGRFEEPVYGPKPVCRSLW